MRILDRDTLILDLDKLGFPDNVLVQYKELTTQPYGMILVTGPTGAVKHPPSTPPLPKLIHRKTKSSPWRSRLSISLTV